MDLNPVYELQERLHAAIIAGANLLQEDFRLKRAIEAIKPLAAASPVFAMLNKQAGPLMSPDCSEPAGVLLDTTALTDAIICTLGTVEVREETKEFELDKDLNPESINTPDGTVITTAPYSQAKKLIDALTTNGSGNFGIVRDMLSVCPDIFKDYRVKPALVKSLGAAYSELAELTSRYLAGCGKEIIPLLKKDFDPKGKKEMVRRVNIIESIAGADENSFYSQMLETATGDVRTALINALRHEPSNFDMLLNMAKSERGKNKQCVLNLLAYKEDGQVYDLFKQLIKKSPAAVLEALLPANTSNASKVIAKTCMEQLPKIIETIENHNAAETEKKLSPFCHIVETLVGKHGDEVCGCYKNLLENIKILDQSKWKPALEVLDCRLYQTCDQTWFYMGENNSTPLRRDLLPKTAQKFTWETVIGSHIAQSLVVFQDKQLGQMAEELYEKNKNINFLAAAALVKIYGDNNCTVWFDEQINNNPGDKRNKPAMAEIQRALSYIRWDKKTNSYITDMVFSFSISSISYDDKRKYVSSKVEIPQAGQIKDWMAGHGSKCMDAILNRWVNTDDSNECEKYGSYFYDKAFLMPENTDYLRYMLNCKWKKCKGLGISYIKNKKQISQWMVTNYLFYLPGNLEDIKEEVNAVIEALKSGEVKIPHLELQSPRTEDWFYILNEPSNYVALTLDK